VTTDVAVRSAEERDLPRILVLLGLMHGTSHPEGAVDERLVRTFHSIINQPGRHLVVAEFRGEVVGTADLLIAENLSRGGTPWSMVENVVVDPRHRRRGIARSMMVHLTALAEGAGCYKIQLISHVRREAAHQLYEGLGFDAPVRGFRRYFR
jgi:GNAT superfamily N-acetyltransferase